MKVPITGFSSQSITVLVGLAPHYVKSDKMGFAIDKDAEIEVTTLGWRIFTPSQ
jgi:hypothetical protein